MNAHAQVRAKLLTKPFMVLAALALIAFAILGWRFLFGLGSVTNINDGYSWGIWIVIDVMIGTAFGCAGYSMALLIYLLNRGEYHPLMRPALLAGLFGYTLAGFAVMFDLGRYWQFYTLLWPGYAQLNSVMLEVAWCVMAYIVVLWIEFTPAFLERFGLATIRKRLSKVLFVFVAIGILLPTMHQSSLGTLATVLGYQISPLWQTQLLPLLFLTTAVLMGYAIVPFEGVLSALGLRRPMETDMLGRVSGVIAILLGIYLVIRAADLAVRGAWGLAFQPNLDAVMFWVENLLFIVPLIFLLSRRNRYSLRVIFLSAFALLLAGSIYRLNIYLIGYHPAGEGWLYFPSITEMLVSIGMLALEILLYLVFVKNLPVLSRAEHA